MNCFRFLRIVSFLVIALGGSLCLFGQDSLRVGVDDAAALSSIVLHSDQDTLLQVFGKRSTDSVWTPIDADWEFTSSSGQKTAAGRSSWRFAPHDTGFGILAVSCGGYFPDTLYVEVRPSDAPESIVIYNSELLPRPGSSIPADPAYAIPITAGTTCLLTAKVFDWQGNLFSQNRLSTIENAIAWNSDELYKGEYGSLDTMRGAVCHFTPTRAYDTVTVVCLLKPGLNYYLIDKVCFVVLPAGGPRRFSVEPKGSLALNVSGKIDTLFIQPNEQSRSVYSAVRDSFGNLVRYGTVSQWVSLDTSVVTIQKGDPSFGEGIVARNPLANHSTARIYAVDSTGAMSDTFVVKLLYPASLREKETIGRSDSWSIAASGGIVRFRTPVHGIHCIKIHSLSGSIVYSSLTSSNDEQIKLPKGGFIVSAQTIGNWKRFTTKIINQ